MITINNESKRILKQLLSKKGEVAVIESADGLSIHYNYKNISLVICKSLDNRFYEIEEIVDDVVNNLVYFTTQSSVIDYLKNNIQ